MSIVQNNNLPTLYQQFIHLSRYSRWLPDKGRRESWSETIDRYFNFFDEHLYEMHGFKLEPKMRSILEEAVLDTQIMPSMRCLMTAGEALKRENIAGYNCSYVAVNRVQAFDEILYVLMNGTGVGFSVERQEVSKLPRVSEEFYESDTVISVADSKLGWAKAFKELVGLLYIGQVPRWDLSKVRPAGAPLKTFGGRASGPEPLDSLFRFVEKTFTNAKGRKLSSIECHDIVCKIAEIVVVGGVRRSALISLSNLSDDRMRHAKSGQWWNDNGQRALANNSACYTEKPDMGIFMDEWKSLYESKSGERGIFSSTNAKSQTEKLGDRRDAREDYGTNPCSEIILRSREFCNLTECVVRGWDDTKSLKKKVRFATILGTWQSTLTNFKYLTGEWKRNCDEERLLGVSLTGIMDNGITNGGSRGLDERLTELRNETVKTNQIWAEKLGIPPSAAITCVKPSGTVSQLCDSASGIHARHSKYYIRTVRGDNKDPLTKFMIDQGVPSEPCVMKPDTTTVFSFPMKSPRGSRIRNDLSAIDQLNIWLIYQEHWCEHKPSITVTVKENEWLDVGAFVFKHFDKMSGVSFLPHSDHVYQQAPYQECTEDEYDAMLLKMKTRIDWSKLRDYESVDNTAGSQTMACSGDSCEIVDIGA